MTRKIVRIALLALIALVAASALFGRFVVVEQKETSILPKVQDGNCKSLSEDGVTVVIQYENQTRQFCVGYAKQSGWDLLNSINASPTGTAQYPTGFVCKLFGYPREQDCKDTPKPSEGTWNYFFATADIGKSWIYSVTGASIRKPKCGDIEAWVFEEPTSGTSAEPPTVNPEPLSC